MNAKKIKKNLLKRPKKIKRTGKDFLSTGSTTLNLACTGHPDRGFCKGRIYFFVGDSSSGKTFICLTCFAEASINPNFDKHRIIFDDVEGGALMDIRKFFGKRVTKRLELYNSRRIEDFYDNIEDAFDDGRPFIYVLDSMDALTSKIEIKKFKSDKAARKKKKETTGSYGDGKAKVNSANLRRLLKPLEKSDSILIIINQTKDNPAAGMFQSKKTTSGGRSLKYYTAIQIWSSVFKKLRKEVRGQMLHYYTICKIAIKKNRQVGYERECFVYIYPSHGIDDIGACVDYLISTKQFTKTKGGYKSKELGIKGSRNKLIKLIEKKGYEKDLRELCGDVWKEIEEALVLNRKKRYE